jgi:prephenate dehydratase
MTLPPNAVRTDRPSADHALTIAHLGPIGTYAETAALICAQWLRSRTSQRYQLKPYASIPLTIQAVAAGEVPLAIVPIENSVEGGVTMTLDSLWQLDQLQIHLALVLPIQHAFLSRAATIDQVQRVYSHPQALSQCLQWLTQTLPQVEIIPTNSTSEGLKYLDDPTCATISSERAARSHQIILLSRSPAQGGSYTSLAFSLSANRPGGLVEVLRCFADRNINLSRIESRPTKRSMGEYLFFLDMIADVRDSLAEAAIADLQTHTEQFKIFGSYELMPEDFVRSAITQLP